MTTLDDVLQQLRDMSQTTRERGVYCKRPTKRIVRVSMETNRIVDSLSALNERDVEIKPEALATNV
jgi:hypothetical protein